LTDVDRKLFQSANSSKATLVKGLMVMTTLRDGYDSAQVMLLAGRSEVDA